MAGELIPMSAFVDIPSGLIRVLLGVTTVWTTEVPEVLSLLDKSI